MELSLLLRGVFEAISDAVNCVQPFRIARVVADLGAQILNVRVDGALIALEVIAEDLLHKLHARIHMAGVAGQRGEQLELARSKINLFAVDQEFDGRKCRWSARRIQALRAEARNPMSAAQKERARAQPAREEKTA